MRCCAEAGSLAWSQRCCWRCSSAAFALAVDFPKAASSFQSDEASYYAAGTAWRATATSRSTAAISRASTRSSRPARKASSSRRGGRAGSSAATGFPWISLAAGPDTRVDRLYFGKSFAYPLAAAPFVWLFGTGGFLLLHALLLSLSLLASYWFLRARSEPVTALAYAAVFFVASAAPVYFVWITPEIFNLSMGVLGLFCGLYADGQPRRAARRQSVEPLPARRRRAVLGAAIIGVAAMSKPTNAALAVPIAAAALLRRDWRIAAAASLAFVSQCGGLFALNLATSGEVNYQGGERATYYEAKASRS